MKPIPTVTGLALLGASAAMPAAAGEVAVVAATATRHGAVWRFDVTVAHADRGWDHYADRWDVLAPDGTLLGSRTLLHPHVDEQPFTRSLDDVTIPPGVTAVVIRAHDKVHGPGGREFTLDLPSGGGS